MRAFLILCVAALSQARPDVGLGYKYQDTDIGILQGSSAPKFAKVNTEPSVSKQFYIHSAPEDTELGETKHITLGRGQKNYRVVFIKAPASNRARLSAEFAPQDEKTVIYVLSQKEHEIDPADIATPEPTQPSKPEVFFIKYKTPEEAEHALHEIQAQYDALGGSTQISDEGLIPVSSAIGTVSSSERGNSAGQFSSVPANNGYLPPNKKK